MVNHTIDNLSRQSEILDTYRELYNEQIASKLTAGSYSPKTLRSIAVESLALLQMMCQDDIPFESDIAKLCKQSCDWATRACTTVSLGFVPLQYYVTRLRQPYDA